MNDRREIPALLCMRDVALILNVPLPRAYALAREGVIPVVRLGRTLRVNPLTLATWLNGDVSSVDEFASVDEKDL